MNLSRIILIGCAVFAVVSGIGLRAEHSETEKETKPVNVLDISEPHVVSDAERRAKTLLAKAVVHVQKDGDESVKDFMSDPEYIDGELYVFALGIDGQFLASGGSSMVLVGDSVLDTQDVYGNPFFREMITKAVHNGFGEVKYHWTNPTDRMGEPKTTFFERVGDVIVAVGYYPERSSAAEAKNLLARAMTAIVESEQESLTEFNDAEGSFVEGDLYVFVMDMSSGKLLAHGVSPELVGRSHNEILSPDDKPILTEMLNLAKENGRGVYTYRWLNPLSSKVETKHTYYRVIDNKLVGVGYYTNSNNT
ncbi:cache domain-containing protein [Vibrio crassostreae]|uniref:cache domain-containing protein n=1 Tax=Vibrio crassostreae TaxID=246167 RepID=UPI001B30FF7C|nr:cache domain-containing protein [Vibrio crassostreae]CAK2789089.1 Single Cache domain-containing protein [Vibrio crassostreae]CAK3289617.1 Single Cache domain-containing protein [Vibrio crassostreae]CAK3302097.1 Single Cache domain-containing protein [Vibrio crassostreae]CAK3325663.1 Single Cache domain-containing protein [Vibrio crassostreae]CAK3400023.1 Single Cache domain-containing protein [Vibrio crassostreae]